MKVAYNSINYGTCMLEKMSSTLLSVFFMFLCQPKVNYSTPFTNRTIRSPKLCVEYSTISNMHANAYNLSISFFFSLYYYFIENHTWAREVQMRTQKEKNQTSDILKIPKKKRKKKKEQQRNIDIF